MPLLCVLFVSLVLHRSSPLLDLLFSLLFLCLLFVCVYSSGFCFSLFVVCFRSRRFDLLLHRFALPLFAFVLLCFALLCFGLVWFGLKVF